MKKTAFDIYHPLIAFSYFAAMLVLSMALIQPATITLSFLGAFTYSLSLQGLRTTLKKLIWQLPLIAIITLVNPLFAAAGSTELFRIAAHPIYLESLVYGACFGGLLVTVMIWFSNASCVLTYDKISALFGNRIPTIALMITMMLRLIPQLILQGKEIQVVQQINQPTQSQTKKMRIAGFIRQSTALMGLSMEGSLETADTMRSRGWDSKTQRTTYKRHSFTSRDAYALIMLCSLVAINGVFAIVFLSQYQFFPTLIVPSVWWEYVPYVLLAFFPIVGQKIEDTRWKL